jgi:isoleucyl-tRNA synthetase
LNDVKRHLEDVSADPAKVGALLAELETAGKTTVLGHELTEADFLIDRGPKDERLIATERGLTVLLDTRLTPALVQEGLAREVVNRVQKLRKESGLAVSDRIQLAVIADGLLAQAVSTFKDYIVRETLATAMTVGADRNALKFSGRFDIEGMGCEIGLAVNNPVR